MVQHIKEWTGDKEVETVAETALSKMDGKENDSKN